MIDRGGQRHSGQSVTGEFSSLTSVGVLGRQPVTGRDLRRSGGSLLRVLLVTLLAHRAELLLVVVGDRHPFVNLHGGVADGHPFLFPVTWFVNGLHHPFDVILGPTSGLSTYTTRHFLSVSLSFAF